MSRESAFLRTRSTTAAASQENHGSTTREVGSDERGEIGGEGRSLRWMHGPAED